MVWFRVNFPRYVLIIMFCSILSAVPAGSRQYDDDYDEGLRTDKRSAHFDASYSEHGFGASLGVRWRFIGASIGLAGFLNNIPNYQTYIPQGVGITPGKPLPDGWEEASYTRALTTFDVDFYTDIAAPVTLTASVGYFARSDSILAHNLSVDTYYWYRYNSESGFTLSAGAEYPVSRNFSLGAGYHSQKGGYLRLVYFWD